MEAEQLVKFICTEKNCTPEEAEKTLELLGYHDPIEHHSAPDALKKAALELWETEFGKSTRNFGLSMHEYNDLASQLKKGNQSLFELVFLRHFGDCLNFLVRHKNIPYPKAYDIAMDTLLAFRQLIVDDKIKYGNLRYLFTRIAVFSSQKMLQKQARIAPIESLESFSNSEQEGPDAESLAILKKALQKLGPECQYLIQSFYYNNCSWKEIATQLNITEEYARKKGQRCRETLRSLIQQFI